MKPNIIAALILLVAALTFWLGWNLRPTQQYVEPTVMVQRGTQSAPLSQVVQDIVNLIEKQ